ncbi:MAG: CpsB/CapC family capsule biosynthesis tyrosine phosphatase [Candidatus Cloacimonadaceae bacterium]|jgi:protein-tyrosine phosphatase|nr:capsular biosynthesis protein [Candidatus Cloacimonadota bacterium]MDY0127147.1 CpsB/CapC family capsule biosynthesis tyrosine phosphatase [Candidatus Cloacimonadaceae bacterium]MCB5255175.1 capsular biosynthesis protein [Candidatus Cloacimonadota bacterium]MCK9177648.1 capsular biosynthesis protein [Candidatus Cloacimonadota bacterium]MCK9242629.1 capsular biosynthesis protein [Candidatus Cloacimonadota bacterium]
MIDIHSHILPNIDDGSASAEQSLQQLKQAEELGVSKIYLTSHYFRGHYQYTRGEYDEKLNNLREQAQTAGLQIEIESGFEVFIQPGIQEDIQEHSLTMGDSRYVLIESELNGLPTDFYANVYPLLRAGYKPILAHAERYVSIMHKPSKARDLVDKNVYIQSNAGAFLGFYGEKVRQTAWTLLENGWTHFLASDDHVKGEYGALVEASKLIGKRIDDHTADLLTRDHPARISNGEAIKYSYVIVKRPRNHRKKSIMRRLFG